QVVVMRVGNLLVARAALAEVMARDDARILEQFHRAVDGRDGNMLVDLGAAAVKLLNVWMVGRIGQHARDDAALIGHAHAFGDALRFDEVQFLLGHDKRPVAAPASPIIGLPQMRVYFLHWRVSWSENRYPLFR